jgi:hypothetical protein
MNAFGLYTGLDVRNQSLEFMRARRGNFSALTKKQAQGTQHGI